MAKKKTKKRAKKKQTPLEKIRKELDKLEALHEKEEAAIENITDILDEEEYDGESIGYGGTDPD